MKRWTFVDATVALSALWLASLCSDAWAGPFDADRARIARERAQADAALAQAEAQCMQRFVVNSCLNEARQTHRAAVEPLRQESMLLDERERKQRAADRLDQVRAKSLAAQARAASSASSAPPIPAAGETDSSGMPGVRPKLRGSSAAPAAPVAADAASATADAAPPPAIDSGASAVPSASPPEKRTKSASKRLTPAPDPAAQQASEKRIAEARAHREKIERRNAERDAKRPPAKGLPVPESASAASAALR